MNPTGKKQDETAGKMRKAASKTARALSTQQRRKNEDKETEPNLPFDGERRRLWQRAGRSLAFVLE